MKFTPDEKNIISIYGSLDREDMIDKLKTVLDNTSEKDVVNCINSIIGKLTTMTDEEYKKTDLELDFDFEEE